MSNLTERLEELAKLHAAWDKFELSGEAPRALIEGETAEALEQAGARIRELEAACESYRQDKLADIAGLTKRAETAEAERDTARSLGSSIFNYGPREGGYTFVTAPEFPGFNAMLEPGQNLTDDHLRGLLKLIALDTKAAVEAECDRLRERAEKAEAEREVYKVTASSGVEADIRKELLSRIANFDAERSEILMNAQTLTQEQIRAIETAMIEQVEKDLTESIHWGSMHYELVQKPILNVIRALKPKGTAEIAEACIRELTPDDAEFGTLEHLTPNQMIARIRELEAKLADNQHRDAT